MRFTGLDEWSEPQIGSQHWQCCRILDVGTIYSEARDEYN
jgi:hypothetical protein